MCDLADLADMEVDLDVPEREISKVTVGQKCNIRADAFEKRVYDGKVDRIMPIADDSKSVIKIRVKVFLPKGEVPGNFLKPKMSVVVELLKTDGGTEELVYRQRMNRGSQVSTVRAVFSCGTGVSPVQPARARRPYHKSGNSIPELWI